MHPALLIVDLQKKFIKESPLIAGSFHQAIKTINETAVFFRQKRLPVVLIQHFDPADGLKPGLEDFDLPDELLVDAGDLRIVKTFGNAFNKTTLLEQLEKLGVDTVIVCGFCAEYCVLNTARGARDVELQPFLLHQGLATARPDFIPFVEAINQVISVEALKVFLQD